MKDSPALAEIVRKIRAKFNTSQSPLTGLSQREMTNPTSNAHSLEYLDRYFIKRGPGGHALDPSDEPPMTPYASGSANGPQGSGKRP